ncbi:Reverse transcriptase (RNA-dependent DNA polymerase) [Fragilaria crotonensis]|nr:Reverse transcriptase (RNA-dependent DNA polymerase) [Fragilaria crotonensis]
MWHSKRQNTVEASTFGSEFQAMKNAVELVESLRYKLRMFGVPVEGPTNVFCDNEAVYKNTSLPESTLKKKHHSIAYHRCREAVAAQTVRVAKEGTKTNLSDLFTKVLPQARREELLDKFTY